MKYRALTEPCGSQRRAATTAADITFQVKDGGRKEGRERFGGVVEGEEEKLLLLYSGFR